MVSLEAELKNCDFNDKRLTDRAIALGTVISENPELSIHAACGGAVESKAAYRFFQNSKVTPIKIMEPHINNTLIRIQDSEKEILIIQDTTDLIYTQFPSISGLGINHKEEKYATAVKGIKLHTSIAVNRSGVPLGILKQSFFTHEDYKTARNQEGTNILYANKKYPIEQKESFRWLEHLIETEKLMKSSSVRTIHVADRECDIYEFLFQAEQDKSSYVVRSAKNRTVKIARVLLAAPGRTKNATSKQFDLKSIYINIVEVKSKPNSKIQLHCKLLTNLSCESFENALNIIDIYKQRWSIECFHRIIKSGFCIEKARLNERSRSENLASILSIVSWHIFWLYKYSRELPDIPASKIYTESVINILKTSAKKLKVPLAGKFTIKKAVLIIARLGGFAARKSDGEPGMINIWRGWRKLNERMEFYEELICG